MDNRIDIYATKQFLDFWNEASFDILHPKYFNSNDLDRILAQGSKIYIDFDRLQIMEMLKLKMFFKRGTMKVVQISNAQSKTRISPSQLTLATDEKNKIDNTINIDQENWSNIVDYISNVKTVQVTTYKNHNDFTGWDTFCAEQLPVDGIIILDRYAFSNENIMKENTLAIVQNLLNNNLSNNIDLTILTDSKNSLGKVKIHNLFKKALSNAHIDVNLSVYELPTIVATHDRKIITNYFMIESGDSFNYLVNEKIKVKTKLTITPLSEIGNIRKELRDIQQLMKKYKGSKIGNGKNKLLENL